MAAMFGQCLSLVTNCLYGEGGGEWGGPVPPIPASQRIPEVILDTTVLCCTVRVTGATSFKEGYFFGAFSILPDTSFLLWT